MIVVTKKTYETFQLEIDHVTKNIMDQLESDDLEGMDQLIEKRLRLLSELFEAYGHEKTMHDYLSEQEKQNVRMMEMIQDQQRMIQSAVKNIQRLHSYKSLL